MRAAYNDHRIGRKASAAGTTTSALPKGHQQTLGKRDVRCPVVGCQELCRAAQPDHSVPPMGRLSVQT
jgi:hypothetical protein